MIPSELIKLQNKILEIVEYLDIFCQEHKISYYLMGGSALGAMRHKGFIPWDDDFDVFMTYDNYVRFIDACEQDLDESKFFLQKENTEEWPMFFTKLRMHGTTFIEPDTKDRKMHKGIYVDVMCLNNVSENLIYRYIQFLCARLITAQTITVRGYSTDSKLKIITMMFAKIFVRGFFKKGLISIVRSKNCFETKLVGHFFGRAKFSKTSFPKEYLGKPRYVTFFNFKFPVPERVEDYLSMRYGVNFMEMPDEKTKSEYPSHASFVNLEKDYREYDDWDGFSKL